MSKFEGQYEIVSVYFTSDTTLLSAPPTGSSIFFSLLIFVLVTISTIPAEAANENKWRVCVVDRPPISRCKPAVTKDVWEPSYAVQLFDEIVEKVKNAANLNDTISLEWKCVFTTTSALIDESLSKDSYEERYCDVLIGPVTIMKERKDLGVQFSYSIDNPSLGVAVSADTQDASTGWEWTKPFTWEMWAAVGIVVFIFVPLAMLLLNWLPGKTEDGKDFCLVPMNEADANPNWYHKLAHNIWMSTWVMVHGEKPEKQYGFNPKDSKQFTVWTARAIFILAFAFVALILTSTYIANFAAVRVSPDIQSDVSTLRDLWGANVLTAEGYIKPTHLLQKKYQLTLRDAAIDRRELMVETLKRVDSSEVDALIYDFPFLVWGLGELEDDPNTCLKLLDQRVAPMQYAFAFAKGFPTESIAEIDEQLLIAESEGTLQERKDIHWENIVENGLSFCGNNERVDTAIGVPQLWGLFVVLGLSFIIGAMLASSVRCCGQKPHNDQEQGEPNNNLNGNGESQYQGGTSGNYNPPAPGYHPAPGYPAAKYN